MNLTNLTNPAAGIVLFNEGTFGGAPRRFSNLFFFLSNKYPGRFYYFVNRHLYSQLKLIYPLQKLQNVYIIDSKKESKEGISEGSSPKFYPGGIEDPESVHLSSSIIRKIYWFYKNKFNQYLLYRQIEKYRKDFDIKVFMGVFSGVLPLVFYMNKTPKKAAVIFSDMDSWFSDVHRDMKKFWYRKYYSFNFALENSDAVDFLSPYILEGVRERGVKIPESKCFAAPCSFTDYSKCVPSVKENIEIAFAARMEPDKNPLMFLEAAGQVLQKYPKVKFHLLGEGTLVYEVKNFIETNRLKEKVNFQFHTNPAEIFAGTSVFVSLQSNTNYPSQSILEAMACENAVIASNVGDTHLLVNEKNGILIPLDVNALVSAVERLIKNPKLTSQMGKSGHEFVLQYHTVEKYAGYFLGLINKCTCELIA